MKVELMRKDIDIAEHLEQDEDVKQLGQKVIDDMKKIKSDMEQARETRNAYLLEHLASDDPDMPVK